ncbi:MAG: T9SS type A sorting domain-containing protein [Reichenbachiella sp.]
MIKRIIVLIALLHPIMIWAQSVTIDEANGWFESAYIKWLPVDNVDGYHVYLTGEGIMQQKIDNQLIREYETYYRADILGLEAGTYTIEVVPVISNVEGTGTVTETITVDAHDRTGFAFNNNATPGAYKADGTPKNDAVILYITENSKNTISLEVEGANANPCVGLETILEGFKKGVDNRPLIIRLIGQITDLTYMDKGDIVLDNKNNPSSYITLEGVGDDAVADGWGIRVKNANNIEIRNIGSMNCNSDEGDNIGLQQNNEHVWIHHCDFFYGDAGGDSDQAKGDGALDCKKSTYVTFSYNHFWDSGKTNLLGLSEGTTEGLYITYHHNWFDHSDSRHPRVRYYSAHVYNNYYDGNSKYGVGSTLGSSVFVEANYFRNCKYPILTSMQGSDVFDENTQANDYSDMPTFSKEDGGSIKAFNNFITGERRFVPYGSEDFPGSATDFDAYVTATREEKISTDVISSRGSNTYNNFDTDATVIYSYTPDGPEEAKEKVMAFAGRMNGGDFDWTFINETDDNSSSVISGLKTALINYETSISSIQGDAEPEDGNGGDGGSGGSSDDIGDRAHNFTTSGLTSTFYTISGSLSDSKGTVIYDDMTLTQCLKMESATSLTFTTSQVAELTMVFNDDFNGPTKINGVKQSAESGIIVITIPSGANEITKGNSTNLYYMQVSYADDESTEESSTMTVSKPMGALSLSSGFVSKTIDLSEVFLDSNNGVLVYTAQSSNEDVVNVSISENSIIINEIGIGSSTVTITATNENEKSVSENFELTVNNSVLNIANGNQTAIHSYPNPTTGIVTITSQPQGSISLYSTQGKKLQSGINNGAVDLSNLKSGIYIVLLQNEFGISRTKLIKE